MSRSPSPEFLRDAVFLVDASSYIFRAYYAISRPLTAPDGTPTHATFGFLQMIQALIGAHGLDHCVLVWDLPGKGFRHALFPKYKANRTAPPEDLGVQIANAREATTLLGLPQIDFAGFEADDILATLIARDPQQNFVIVTADKDLLQLVGPRVWCLDTMKDKWSNREEAQEKFGVPPERIRDVQALSGDSVDNVPGVPGIGGKTAAELIGHFGDLETLLQEARRRAQDLTAKWNDPLKGKRLEKLVEHEQDARVSLELVSLRADVPLAPGGLARHAADRAGLEVWAQRLGFTRIVERLLPAVKEGAGISALPVSREASASSVTPSLAAPSEASASASVTPSGIGLGTGSNAKPRTEALTSLEAFRARLAAHAQSPTMAFDTETFALGSMRPQNLVGLSFAFSDDEGCYVPLRHRETEHNVDPARALEALDAYWQSRARDPNFSLVLQNAKFDLHALANDGLRLPPSIRLDDTMIASFVYNPASAHGLDALAARWLQGYETVKFGELVGKGGDFSDVPVETASFYAAEDAVVCHRLWGQLAPRLREENLWRIYDEVDRPLIQSLFEMERQGIALDLGTLHELSKSYHEQLGRLHEKALDCLKESGLSIGPGFNVNSPKQVARVLYEELKLPVLKKLKTGPSTDVSVLAELAEQHPFPRILLEIREVTKLLTTYVDALPAMRNERTGRVHSDFSQVVAATGRLASSNPNLQNIPIKTQRGRDIRRAFQAAPGYSLVGIDYSQIELRLLAWVSRDPELLKAFQENVDVHCRTAALVLSKPESAVTDADRRIAKTINYGIVYGQTAFGLSKTLGISRVEAQNFIDGYFRTYPRIRAYMDMAIAEAKAQQAVRTATGRRRPLPEIISRNVPLRQFAERMAINTPLQGLAADLMKVAMIHAHDTLARELPEARLLLQVHDELVVEVPQAKAEQARAIVTRVLEAPDLLASLTGQPFDVPMKTESAIGRDWESL
jgi:DNA polymerase-1